MENEEEINNEDEEGSDDEETQVAAPQEGPEKRTAAKRVMDRQTIFILHVSVESRTE